MIPKESEGEQFEEALARVRRCVGGGTAMENADSDSDLEIVADAITVNLRCPVSLCVCARAIWQDCNFEQSALLRILISMRFLY